MKKQLVYLSQIADSLEKQGNLKAGRQLTLAMKQIVAADRVQRKLLAGVWKGRREQMLEDPDFRKLPEWQRERVLEQFETMGSGEVDLPELSIKTEQPTSTGKSYKKLQCHVEPHPIEGLECCFLSPDGTAYPVRYAGHWGFASQMVKLNDLAKGEFDPDCILILNELGWVDLHSLQWRKYYRDLTPGECTPAQAKAIQRWIAALDQGNGEQEDEYYESPFTAALRRNTPLEDWFMS